MINVMKYASSYNVKLDGPTCVDACQWWDMENHVQKADISGMDK